MQVRVRLFAVMAQQAGLHEIPLTLPPNSPVSAVQPELTGRLPNLRWPPGTLLAVNQAYVPPSHPLQEGDEVAIIPPVSGG